jgi:LysR family transcriptional regulator, pca operon transcriptional activator
MRQPNISLRHVRVFLEIVGQRSLRRAAASLHITESAVSKSLRELEDELDTTLLVRNRKGLSLTPAGEDFHVHASQSMAGFARAVESVHGRTKKRTLLRIGALPTAAASIVPHAVHRMLERYPEVDIDVTSGAFEYLASKLRLGELDLLVGRMISRDTVGLSFERLYEEDVLAIVRSGHPLTRTDVINVESLAAYTVIAPPANSQVRTMVDDFLFASQAHTNLKFIESQSETFSRAYVCQHDTVWFVPAGVVEVDLRLHVLLALPIHSPLLRAPIGMTTMAGSPTSAQGEAFAKVLREIAQEGSNSSRYQAK